MKKMRVESSIDAFVIGALLAAATGGIGTLAFWIGFTGWMAVSALGKAIDQSRGLT